MKLALPYVKILLGTSSLVGESLLNPTRIHVESFYAAVPKDLVKDMAYVTGGGLFETYCAMLLKGLTADLDAAS